jgi:hypothetical protein
VRICVFPISFSKQSFARTSRQALFPRFDSDSDATEAVSRDKLIEDSVFPPFLRVSNRDKSADSKHRSNNATYRTLCVVCTKMELVLPAMVIYQPEKCSSAPFWLAHKQAQRIAPLVDVTDLRNCPIALRSLLASPLSGCNTPAH